MRRRTGKGTRRDRGVNGSVRARCSPAATRHSPRLLALTTAIVLMLAVFAPAGQASASSEGQTETGAARAATRSAEKEAVRQEHKAENQARKEATRARRQARKLAKKEVDHAKIEIGCTGITVQYGGFSSMPGSSTEAIEYVTIRQKPLTRVTLPVTSFEFSGAEGTSTIPIAAPIGSSQVVVRAKWLSGDGPGGFGVHEALSCDAAPSFGVETLQAIAGSGQPLGVKTLSGRAGQTVAYESILTNTGNTPLRLTSFSDPGCDPGSIAGLSEEPVQPMGKLEVFCSHKLTNADAAAGSYVNAAQATAAPEAGQGAAIGHEAKAVIVSPIAPEPVDPAPPAASGTKSPGSTTSATKSGVLGFASTTVPALRGPRGCVRGEFTVRVSSPGVESVIFYLDGRKLKRLTHSNASKGLLSVRINGAKLKVGSHKVLARITMTRTSPTAKAAQASRTLKIVRCHPA
ncbi:MAG: hypothetical protein ACLQBB_02755 [Solirubrobacteraceae bacterium]